MEKRVVAVYMGIVLCFSFLVLRLFWLSQDQEILQSGISQGSRSVEITQSRGMIYDCNLDPIVNLEEHSLLAVRPGREAASVLLTEDITGTQREELLEKLSGTSPFLLTQLEEPLPQGEGLCQVTVKTRYPSPFFFPHVVGYVDYAGNGVTGIEKACDDFLQEHTTHVQVTFPSSAVGDPLHNQEGQVEAEEEDRSGVVLTLDSTLQRGVYYAAEKRMEQGAALVMDVETGQVKAMVSFPDFDPNQVELSLDEEDAPMINRCISGYNLGSIFKIVTAACALENGYSTQWTYTCPGYIDVEGQIFHCHHLAGHGEMNMLQAMEQSCNPYFIALSLELGAVKLYETAYRLGFGQDDEYAPGLFSSQGSLPKPYDIRYDAELANIGFGQGSLLATPLQVGKLLCTVANGGKSVSPTLLLGYTNREGTQLEQTGSQQEQEQLISSQTAEILRSMLIQVVEEGSGSSAKPLHLGAGGKTGSAQTGHYNEDGEEIVQAWFAGFYPAQEPRYAIVVLIEGGESGALEAAPVFREICDYLWIYEQSQGEGEPENS